MKDYRQDTVITNGQYTEITRISAGGVNTELFMAINMKKGKPCSEQCDLYNHFTERCSGHCYRWRNCGDIVFVHTVEPQRDYVVTETEFAKGCREPYEPQQELNDNE